MDNETIKKILDLAVLAPSGDNVQPWRFEMREEKLFLFDVPERDDSLYNFQSLAAYINHGTLLENIRVASFSFGYETSFELVLKKDGSDLIAVVLFKKKEPQEHPLFSILRSRHTNRKPYDPKPLLPGELVQLKTILKENEKAQLFFVSENTLKKRIAKAVSKNEIVLFGNSKLHNFFYKHIHWVSAKDDELGFPVETLEIPKEAFPVFRALRSWKVSRVLSFFKFPAFIASENAKLYASAGAHGAIVCDEFSPETSILTGMVLERLWLQSEKMGLRFQPLMGIAFLMERVRAGDTELSQKNQRIIRDAYREMAESFGVSRGVIMGAFRIGRGPEPSGRTKRLPVKVTFC